MTRRRPRTRIHESAETMTLAELNTLDQAEPASVEPDDQWLQDQRRPLESHRQWLQRTGRKPKRSTVFPVVAIQTDSTFMSGSHIDDGLNAQNRDHHLARARAAGVSTAGKRFIPQMVPEGDWGSPEAWVGGRQDVKDHCERTGDGCEGGGVGMTVPAREQPPEPEMPAVAPDIVTEEVVRIVREEAGGTLPTRELRDLKEKVAADLAPPKPDGMSSLRERLQKAAG